MLEIVLIVTSIIFFLMKVYVLLIVYKIRIGGVTFAVIVMY